MHMLLLVNMYSRICFQNSVSLLNLGIYYTFRKGQNIDRQVEGKNFSVVVGV